MHYFYFFILAALCLMPSVGYSQLSLPIPDRSKEWRRIYTDQESTTDVGVSTLVLEPNGLLRATFRISLSKSEEAAEKPGAKYKVRLLHTPSTIMCIVLLQFCYSLYIFNKTMCIIVQNSVTVSLQFGYL